MNINIPANLNNYPIWFAWKSAIVNVSHQYNLWISEKYCNCFVPFQTVSILDDNFINKHAKKEDINYNTKQAQNIYYIPNQSLYTFNLILKFFSQFQISNIEDTIRFSNFQNSSRPSIGHRIYQCYEQHFTTTYPNSISHPDFLSFQQITSTKKWLFARISQIPF